MRELKAIGKVVLGGAVIAATLLLFSPIGHYVCGPSRCAEGELYGQGHWAMSGFVGFFATGFTIVILLCLYVLGDWTTDRVEDVKYEIDTWYQKRQLERIPHEALEDNGGDDRPNWPEKYP